VARFPRIVETPADEQGDHRVAAIPAGRLDSLPHGEAFHVPRAEDVRPAPHGDDCTYVVDKYWVVAEARPNGEIVAATHRGKRHLLRADDPALKRATWWEQLFHGGRFPARHESKSVS
jgi:hypothetical protein